MRVLSLLLVLGVVALALGSLMETENVEDPEYEMAAPPRRPLRSIEAFMLRRSNGRKLFPYYSGMKGRR